MANSLLPAKRPRKPQPKAGPFRLNTALKIAIVHFLGRPGMTQEQIAHVLGCDRKTVGIVARIVRQIPAELNLELEDYRRQLRTRLPNKTCVDAISTIVGKVNTNPWAAMRGIEYRDSMLGLHPKARDDGDQGPREPAPMFNLPPGSKVQVNILTGPADQDRRQIGGDSNEQ